MIETKTEDYKSHKHSYNVYVEINSKTKLGQDLLEQYHRQAKNQYIDIGRIGYHDHYGRYIIDQYSLFELISIPKLIIGVTESAIDKAGRDEYRLRTYMSKFGQLNFILLVDRNSAELILVENVFIENLNHKENYETLIYKLRYSSGRPVPLREIFFKFGIKANPDDYGKSFKNEGASINNLIVAKAKAELTIKLANTIANMVNQKALVTSLNYLNKEGTYGKNVTKEYSKKVSKSKELNDLTSSPKLENTLNNVLVKTLEQQTTKADIKDKTNYKLYKKVLDVEFSSLNEVKKGVKELNTKQNLKVFMLETYQKHTSQKDDEEEINEEKFKTFEKIIEKQYSHKPNKELSKPIEEDFKTKDIVVNKNQDFYDFNNKKVNIDFNLSRFNTKEDPKKKQINKQLEKLEKKQEKKKEKQIKLQNKNLKVLNAECDLDEEFERSKLTLGILPTDSKRKKKKALKLFFSEDKKKDNKKTTKKKVASEETKIETENKTNILEKIEKQIRSQKIKKQEKKKIKEKTKSKKSINKSLDLQSNESNNYLTNTSKQNNKDNLYAINNENITINNSLENKKANVKDKKTLKKEKNKKGLFFNKNKKTTETFEETLDENETKNKIKNNKLKKSAVENINQKTNQPVKNNSKEDILYEINKTKKKKSNNDTLALKLDNKDIKQEKEHKNKKPESQDLLDTKKQKVTNNNEKTNRSGENAVKITENEQKQKYSEHQVTEIYNTKQQVLNNIQEEKSKKITQYNIIYDDDFTTEVKPKTTKSTNNIIPTNSTNALNKQDLPHSSIGIKEQSFTKKRKPPQDLGREM